MPDPRTRRHALAAIGVCAITLAVILVLRAQRRDDAPVLPGASIETPPDQVTTRPRAAAVTEREADPTVRQADSSATDRAPVEPGLRPPARGTWTARVLTPDGQPLADGWLAIDGSWTTGLRPTVQTDDAGRCEGPLAPALFALDDRLETAPPPPAGERVTLTLTLTRRADSGFRITRARTAPGVSIGPRVRATFTWPDDGSDVDLGTLVLEHAPILVAGIAVDARDLPVDARALQWALACPMPAPVSLEGGHRQPLVVDEDFYVTAGDGGRFALHGNAPPDALGLWLWARDVDRGLRTFDPLQLPDVGAQGVVVELVGASRIEAEVVLTGTARMEDLNVRIDEPGAGAPGWNDSARVTRTRRADHVELTVGPVRPGRHDVVFELGGTTVLRVDGVEFPPDGPSVDPRLARIVLAPR